MTTPRPAPHPAPPYDAVIFDCDGVLLDTETLALGIWIEQLAAGGLELDPASFHAETVGMTVDDILTRLSAQHGFQAPITFRDQLDRKFGAGFEERLPLVPGARDLLEAVRAAGLPLACASNSDRAGLDYKLTRTGLAVFFTGHTYSADDVASPKPAPDLYRHAASALGLTAARCLVIEDSVTGVRAGSAAGATVWGLTACALHPETAGPALVAAGADAIFGSVGEVRRALGL